MTWLPSATWAAVHLNGSPASLSDDGSTVFIVLPSELRRPIDGGCSCPYCQANPSKIPCWDTLAVATRAPDYAWTVHRPEPPQRAPRRRGKRGAL